MIYVQEQPEQPEQPTAVDLVRILPVVEPIPMTVALREQLQAFALWAPTMAIAPMGNQDEVPVSIRIGPARNNFVHTLRPMRPGEMWPTYDCRRNNGDAPDERMILIMTRMLLMRRQETRAIWVAFHGFAQEGAQAALARGHIVFGSCDNACALSHQRSASSREKAMTFSPNLLQGAGLLVKGHRERMARLGPVVGRALGQQRDAVRDDGPPGALAPAAAASATRRVGLGLCHHAELGGHPWDCAAELGSSLELRPCAQNRGQFRAD
jgi:hypothetical protein